jgi:REP element-mobilizing transposase RayT
MPQSLSAVYIHLVFSTKDRRPLLRDNSTRDALHAYLGGVSKQLDCPPIQIGGVEDHVHILARFGRTITQAEWVKELKRVLNLWLKERGRDYADFEWQGGYADFSVSQSKLPDVKDYIADRRSITARSAFRTNCGRCCACTRSNGMRNMFGIEPPASRRLPQPRCG